MSAILLVVLEPTSAGLAGSRVIEALVGGGVALARERARVPARSGPARAPLGAGRLRLARADARGAGRGAGRARRRAGGGRPRRRRARSTTACAALGRGAGARARDRSLLACPALLARGAGSLRAKRAAHRLRGPQHARARAPRGALPAQRSSRAGAAGRGDARPQPGRLGAGGRARRPGPRRRRRSAATPRGPPRAPSGASRATATSAWPRSSRRCDRPRSTSCAPPRPAAVRRAAGGDAHRGAPDQLPAPA